MREIVVDTETTGLEAQQGHKIVEIGCVELQRSVPTGNEFHRYLNPERDIPESAREIHGIDEDFVKTMPRFGDIALDLLDFFGDAILVMHNAPFDLGFLNAELEHCARPPLANSVCDTLVLAQDRFRGERVGLDALCRRYRIDLSERERHGALIDARLLAKVYLELCGGRQQGIGFAAPQPVPVSGSISSSGSVETSEQSSSSETESRQASEQESKTESKQESKQESKTESKQEQRERPPFRVLPASPEEKEAHLALLAKIEQKQP